MDFNDIKKTISETASSTGKKAGELVNKTKVRFALANMQTDLDELYERLGKLHYDALSTGADNGTKESALITKIDSLKADMEILKAEIGLFPKRGKECPHCGKAIPKSSTFCPYCGKEV